jgi:hypothetical protein
MKKLVIEKFEIRHESTTRNIVWFKVFAGPDTTEGRYGPRLCGYVAVHANGSHNMFAEHWCYKKYGSTVTFCMGVFGSNAVMSNWRVERLDSTPEMGDEDCNILALIEERFVDKIWDRDPLQYSPDLA